MPVHRVNINGKDGWQYGQTGKVYYGPDARRKAEAQAAAIHASQNKRAHITYREVLDKMAAVPKNGLKPPTNPYQKDFDKLCKGFDYNTKPPKPEKPKNEKIVEDPRTNQYVKITWGTTPAKQEKTS